MYFDSLQSALAMGHHGLYVWSAYSVAIAVIVMVVIAPVLRRRKILRQLDAQLKRAEGLTAGSVRSGN